MISGKRTIILTLFLLSMLMAPQVQSQATDIKIGILVPMTGALSVFSQSYINASLLAMTDLELMFPSYNFAYETLDTETNVVTARSAAMSFADDGVDGVVGPASSQIAFDIIDVLSDAEIPLISYANTLHSLSDYQDNDYYFRVIPSEAVLGSMQAFVTTSRGVTKAGMIIENHTRYTTIASSFEDTFLEISDRHSIIESLYFNTPTSPDYSSLVSDLIGNSIMETVFIITDGLVALDIMIELENQNYSGLITLNQAPTLAQTDPHPEAERIFHNAGHLIYDKLSSSTDFQEQYLSRYNTQPGELAGQMYDALMIMAQAIVFAAENELDNRLAIHTIGTDYKGASGLINFDANGDSYNGHYNIMNYLDSVGSHKIGEIYPATNETVFDNDLIDWKTWLIPNQDRTTTIYEELSRSTTTTTVKSDLITTQVSTTSLDVLSLYILIPAATGISIFLKKRYRYNEK